MARSSDSDETPSERETSVTPVQSVASHRRGAMPQWDSVPRLLIVDGDHVDLGVASGIARAIAAEREVAARDEEDRHRAQLERLVEASVAITGAPTLERATEATVEAIAAIFEATGRSVLTQADRHVHAGPAEPFAPSGGGIRLVSPPNAHGVGGTLEVSRPSRPLDPSERLVAAHLHLVTLASAERLLLLTTAQEKARERQEIVAIVSHDLRTPLQTFAMGLDAIERTVSGPARTSIEATTARMKRSITSMTRLLEDLLDVSRIHDGALPLRVARHAIAPLLEELCAQHLPMAHKRGIALHAEVEPELEIVCDAERLTQALGNVLSNALRHTDRGSITLRARRIAGARARIEVADTGVGIAPDVRARLFERLYQGETSGRAGGLGLGLFIVQGIVGAHGGSVAVDSDVGRGTTFSIELPLGGPTPASVSG